MSGVRRGLFHPAAPCSSNMISNVSPCNILEDHEAPFCIRFMPQWKRCPKFAESLMNLVKYRASPTDTVAIGQRKSVSFGSGNCNARCVHQWFGIFALCALPSTQAEHLFLFSEGSDGAPERHLSMASEQLLVVNIDASLMTMAKWCNLCHNERWIFLSSPTV